MRSLCTAARCALLFLVAFHAVSFLSMQSVVGDEALVQETVSEETVSEKTVEQEGWDETPLAVPSSMKAGIRSDVEYLASEELRGRSVTDETIGIAANYLVRRMKGVGLKTNQVDGGALQSVSIAVGSEVASLERNFFQVQSAGKDAINVSIGDGYGPLTIGTDSGKAKGHLVFAGYGITSETHAYDDFQNLDVQGAIVMILRKEPLYADPDSPFDGTKNTRHAYFATKIANAVSRGAAGVLFINDLGSAKVAAQLEQNRIDQETRRKEGLNASLANLPLGAKRNRAEIEKQIASIDQMMESMKADLRTAQRGVLGLGQAGNKTNESKMMPIGSIARDLASKILKDGCGKTLEELESQIDTTIQPASQSLPGVTGELSVELKPASVTSDNVIGMLPGKGALSRENIVIGAHYDHVGMGGFASLAPGTIAIHNGADDNASGTAGMLACAAKLTQQLASAPSHRSVIFIGFTGEERGLLGSQYYVDHPVEPLASTAAMINLDMIGRLRDNELTVYGTGSADTVERVVDQSNERFGFNLYKVASGFGPSDHQSFYRRRVPVLFFFTGLHNDYHRPSDDFDKIDFSDLTRVSEMVADVAYRLSTMPRRPQYAETAKTVQIRRQMTAYLGVRVSSRAGVVNVTEVTKDGPAEKANLQLGDELMRIGKKNVRSTDDVLAWVRNHSPDDVFEMQVRRQGKFVTLSGKLGKRDL